MKFPSHSDTGIQLPISPAGIAFDLDGTLLDYDGRLDQSVVKAVRRIHQAGIKVFLVTGRLESGCTRYWQELELDTPVATCNGARAGFPGEEPFMHIRLPRECRDAIIDLEAKHGLYINYYIDTHVYSTSDGPFRDWYSQRFSLVEKAASLDDIAARPLPTKCLCIAPEGEYERVRQLFVQALGDTATITSSNPNFIEILSPDANKAVGLRALADWAKIPLSRFIAAGDGLNDLPMLQAAGFAISFKSGDPRLIDEVDMLLPPLWEDGIEVLAKCVLGMTNSGRFLTPRSGRFAGK